MKHSSSLLAGWAMLIALAIFSIPAAATRYYVNDNGGADNNSGTGSWAAAYQTLQKALENASADDEIWVAKGTYYPTHRADNGILSPDDRDNAFVLKKDVKIYGGFAGDDDNEPIDQRDWATNKTTLSGDIGVEDDSTDNAYHVVITVGCSDTALLDGLTISGGNADGGSSSINVNNQNMFRYCGGGMYNNYSSPVLTNVTISGNTAASGGGMHNSISSPVLTNVTISDNTATTSDNVVTFGGGMYNNSSSPVLTNVTISGNTATNGGGMHNSISSPVLTNVTISGNTANTNGGGMFNDASFSNSISSPKLTNVTISGNTATNGGGMYNSSSSSSSSSVCSPVLTNVTIGGNTATNGGGMYNSSSSSSSSSVCSPVLTNVTIGGNTATNGGGIYNYSPASSKIYNSIIWGNGNSNLFGSRFTCAYSLVQDSFPTGDGNLDGTDPANDPRFVDAAGGDYRLQWHSPVINAGSNSLYAATGAGTTDLDGNLRIRGNPDSIDMGAYEFIELFPTNGIIYVDVAVAAGSKHDGSSWANAVTGLDEALFYNRRKIAADSAADSIFMAKGTYYPTQKVGNVTADRAKAFVLVKDMKIYGGFAGNEEVTIDRDWKTNKTILSGNIGALSKRTDNAYHVVISAGCTNATLLDGLTISDGNANGSGSITVNNKLVDASFGGGIYNDASSPTLVNVAISSNAATHGAGIYNDSSSSPLLTNAIINNNTATNGGGMYNNNASSPVLTNVTIGGNTATTGGGIYNNNSSSTPTIQNSIIWGNNSGVYNGGSAVPEYKYSLVQGEHLTGDGNLDSTINPQFVDAGGGDYRLQWSSPVIDVGNNSLNATTKDLAGNPRRFGTIDMGAYENQDNYYTVIMPDGDVTGISSINITVDENDYLQFLPGEYHVHPGSNFTFTLIYADGYDETPAVVENNGDTLSPNDAGTYTISDEAVVTITGVANSNGYDGIGLIITDGTTSIIEHIYIDSIEVPFDTTKAVNYILACGQSGKLNFSLTTEASGPALITIPPLDTAFDFIPKPGLNHIPVNIFAIDGTVSHQYDFVIEKRFEYDSLIAQKWNNTLLVRSNPNNNGGYTFVDYEWFCNNTSIGTEGFYSAGNKRTDLLNFDALYYAEMHTNDGQKLQTCPQKPVKTAAAASLRVYPNPVRRGNIAHIQSGTNSEQLLNLAEPTEVSIYNSMGKFVKMQKLTAPLTEFVLDVAPGIYFIRLGDQQVKVVVD